MNINEVGALCFGVVTGYIAYRTLIRAHEKASISDLATVIGVVGGGVITGLFKPTSKGFGYYSIGLLVGMAVFLALFFWFNGKQATGAVMGAPTIGAGGAPGGGDPGPKL